ncbi:arginine--tRNA ligase [Phosphitispora fastidiosa]|uniref:arginine--tRNA ligase n=1 Tax=Phosphitispora fastidiosa TaxID=2837202 RepID=UPI001E59D742|nr:arginine--tRNA ligase [Phosphitispora fastidiosa]MBU7007332.1 arginyl-tRNA synthetase [Phosphitispora fastidiosa]
MQSVLENVKNNIVKAIEQAAQKAKDEGKLGFDALPAFVLEVPREKEHGDFATNIAMLLTRQARMAPRQIAETIAEGINTESARIARIEIAGPGFINFFLESTWVYDVLPQVEKEGELYGDSATGQGKKVQVEFVSANPTGLLHMGNARGAALGDTMAALMQAAGFEVSREFYINDAGNQIENFGKSLEARYLQLLERDVPFPKDGYHGADIIDTVKGIIEKHGDRYLDMESTLRKEFFIKYALDEKIRAIKKTLSQFGVEYDVWFSEQSLHESGAIDGILDQLREKGFLYESEGALWLKTTEFGDEKDEVLVRSNGIPTYFAADIAYHKNKFDRGFEWVINIWGADHHGHVKRLKGAMQALGYNPDSLDIVLMQLVRLFKGGDIIRMSKRSGEFITLDDLMSDVGIDAARYFFVMRSSDSHLDFDMDLAKSQSTENPVYYIQYAHARICSILRQLEDRGETVPLAEECNFRLLQEQAELDLMRKLADFPMEISEAAVNLEPHRIARYAHELAGLFHSFYNSHRVMVEDVELQKARLVLVKSVQTVVRRALGLIGVTAPESM